MVLLHRVWPQLNVFQVFNHSTLWIDKTDKICFITGKKVSLNLYCISVFHCECWSSEFASHAQWNNCNNHSLCLILNALFYAVKTMFRIVQMICRMSHVFMLFWLTQKCTQIQMMQCIQLLGRVNLEFHVHVDAITEWESVGLFEYQHSLWELWQFLSREELKRMSSDSF